MARFLRYFYFFAVAGTFVNVYEIFEDFFREIQIFRHALSVSPVGGRAEASNLEFPMGRNGNKIERK